MKLAPRGPVLRKAAFSPTIGLGPRPFELRQRMASRVPAPGLRPSAVTWPGGLFCEMASRVDAPAMELF